MSPGLLRIMQTMGGGVGPSRRSKSRTLMRTGSNTRIGRRTHNARRSQASKRPSVGRITRKRKLL